MKDKVKGIAIGIVIGAMISATTTFAFRGGVEKLLNYCDIKIFIDGKKIDAKDANGTSVEPFIIDGTTYLPVRAIGEAFGKEVSWDGNTNSVYVGKKPDVGYIGAYKEKIEDLTSKCGIYVEDEWTGVKGLKYGALVDFENDSVPELVLCHDLVVKVYRYDAGKATLIYNKDLGLRYMQTDVSPTFGIKESTNGASLITYHSQREWADEDIHIFTVKNGEPDVVQISARKDVPDEEAEFSEFTIYDVSVSRDGYMAFKKDLFDGMKHVDALWNISYNDENYIDATDKDLQEFLKQFGL